MAASMAANGDHISARSSFLMYMFSNSVMCTFEFVVSFSVQCKRHEMTLMNEVHHCTGIHIYICT